MLPGAASAFEPGLQEHIGDYELLEEIARGGMGIVYRARQVSLNRIVAVKMILAGPLASDAFVQRFRAEAAAAARLHHPNIVAIHEIGEEDGQHYFSMDYVQGRDLASAMGDFGLQTADWKRVARLVAEVSEAVDYAHQQNILHRDLKPSNIVMDSNGAPHITDFGLAKELDRDSSVTLTGQMLGSPNYISPEQALGTRESVGPASDVYSLGAILYHLLTGRAPFAGLSLGEILEQIRTEDPPGPRLLNSHVPRDLETISLKCLQKEPSGRYPTAAALADDLKRFLANEPICARPVSRMEKTWRWCRRRPGLAISLGALAVALVCGVTGIAWQWRRAEVATVAAETESLAARRDQYTSDMLVAQQALVENDHSRAMQLLEAYRPSSTQSAARGARLKADLRNWEWRYLWRLASDDPCLLLGTHANDVRTVGVLPDGKTAFSGGLDGKVKFWGLPSGPFLTEFEHALAVWSSVASPDGRWMVTGALGMGQQEKHGFHFWDLTNRRELAPIFTNHWPRSGQSVAISPDSKYIVFNQRGPMVIAELLSGREVDHSLPSYTGIGGPQAVAFTPDGQTLLCAAEDVPGEILVVETEHWTEVGRLRGHTRSVNALAVSPDGRRVASISADRSVRLWDLRERRSLASRGALSENGWSLASSPDGQSVAFGVNSLIEVRRVPDLSPMAELKWLSKGAHCVQYLTPTKILAGGGDGSVKVFSMEAQLRRASAVRPREGLAAMRRNGSTPGFHGLLSPDGAYYLTVFTNDTFSIWSTSTLEERGPFPLPMTNLSCSAIATGGDLIAFAGQDGETLLWHGSSGEVRPFARPSTVGFASMAFSHDSRLLAFTELRTSQIWDVATATRIQVLSHPYPTYLFCPSFTPDGGRLIGSTHTGDQMVWRLDQSDPILRLSGLVVFPTGFAITADGNTLIAPRNEVRFWNLTTGVQTHQIPPTYGEALCVALSPDDSRLAVGMVDGTIVILDATTFREVAVFHAFDSWIWCMAFTRDGNTLFASTLEEFRIWKAATWEEVNQAAIK